MGHAGLALATSVTSIASLIQLGWLLRRRLVALDGSRIAGTFVRVLSGAAVVAGLCAVGLAVFGAKVPAGFSGRLMLVGGAFAFGIAGFWAAFRLLGIDELHALEDLARGLVRRLRGGASGSR